MRDADGQALALVIAGMNREGSCLTHDKSAPLIHLMIAIGCKAHFAMLQSTEAITEPANPHRLSNQIRDVARADPLHYPGAMVLHGLRADVEPDRDLFA